MASIRIPCLAGKTNKAGVISWYWPPSTRRCHRAAMEKAWLHNRVDKIIAHAVKATGRTNMEKLVWHDCGAPASGACATLPQ